VIGQSLCPECFDYGSAVLFNGSVAALWDRTVQATAASSPPAEPAAAQGTLMLV
jgi:hypothetical protein